MKKILFVLFVSFWQMANAQFTKLFDFNDTLGNQPHGTVVSDGTYLYGMTSYGGAGGGGILFKIKPDGSGYDTLINFKGDNGYQPVGSLMYDGTYLYGGTNQGGSSSRGVLFKVRTDGSGYQKLLDFSVSIGAQPTGNLITDGKYLYGTTGFGGTKSMGTIFKIKPDGTGFSKLYDFGTISYDGNNAFSSGGLTLNGSILYGLTNEGGVSNEGTIYKIDTDGTGYHKLLDFPGSLAAWYPEGALLVNGDYLYGVLHYGGLNTGGVIFKIKPDGTGFDTVFNFTGINGCTPMSGLISDGTFFYGTTSIGGSGFCSNGNGIIYKIKPDGTGFEKLLDFNGSTNGKYPYGPLCYDGTFLYGMTAYGGAYDDGVIFKYYPLNISLSMAGNPTCGNKCNGAASVSVLHGTPPYSYTWNTSPAETTSIASKLCSGKTYKVTVTDKYGYSSDSIKVTGIQPQPSPAICGVTVDSLSEHNIIFWDNSIFKGTGVDSFIIFREINTNNYQPIGEVSYDSLSFFIDTVRSRYFPNTGNPNNGTYRYKLVAHDTCGMLSDVSFYHNTIFVNANNGTFTWNLYSIENSPNPVTSYLLLRDDNSNGNWHSVASVSGTQQTVSDPQYASYQKTGSWRVETQWGITCSPSIGTHKTGTKDLHLNSSLSNIYSANGSGINQKGTDMQLWISPDPATDHLFIEISQSAKIEIVNVEGLVLNSFQAANGNKSKVDVSSLSKGIYFVRVVSGNGILIKKFIKQ